MMGHEHVSGESIVKRNAYTASDPRKRAKANDANRVALAALHIPAAK